MQVVGEISGLTSSLLAERLRVSRLLKRKRGLELEVAKVKEEAASAAFVEKAKWEKGIADLQVQISREQALVQTTRELLATAKEEKLKISDLLSAEREANCKLKTTIAELTQQKEGLEAQLRVVPSPDTIVADFKGGDVYKGELIAARLAGIAAYKGSSEFEDEQKLLAERAIRQYKEGLEYAADIEKLKATVIAEYSKSIAFRQAVGLEAGKMSRHVVECCREFLKDDLDRDGNEFGNYFMSFMKRQRSHGSGAASSLGSAARSAT